MAKVLGNVHAYGDTAGAVFVAPKGTTMPVGLVAPAAAFVEVGWISEDGVNIAKEVESSTFPAWQGAKVVKRKPTSSSDSFTFTALEENPAVMQLFLPGATAVTATGTTTITPAAGLVANEHAFVIDFREGTDHKRYNVTLGAVSEYGEVPHQNGELTAYQFTVEILEYTIVTNLASLAAPWTTV